MIQLSFISDLNSHRDTKCASFNSFCTSFQVIGSENLKDLNNTRLPVRPICSKWTLILIPQVLESKSWTLVVFRINWTSFSVSYDLHDSLFKITTGSIWDALWPGIQLEVWQSQVVHVIQKVSSWGQSQKYNHVWEATQKSLFWVCCSQSQKWQHQLRLTIKSISSG